MKKKLTSVILFLALSAGVVSAQTSKVTGKVIGEDGEPVIGASIIVKGTTVGTVTDFDGNFELEVPANGKQLVISYIGMKSQEVAATSNVNVKLLADTQNLDEVVVTAMGISKEKKALGYAVQDVKADELTKGANTSLSGALQGKVSGVEISPSSGMPGGLFVFITCYDGKALSFFRRVYAVKSQIEHQYAFFHIYRGVEHRI